LAKLDSNGGETKHVEHWFVYDADVKEDEDSIDQQILPLVEISK
jgi:hypothetical protein